MIAGAYSKGRFWAEGGRDVTDAGVKAVMDIFFSSRLPELYQATSAAGRDEKVGADSAKFSRAGLLAALDAECDEMFLDKPHP